MGSLQKSQAYGITLLLIVAIAVLAFTRLSHGPSAHSPGIILRDPSGAVVSDSTGSILTGAPAGAGITVRSGADMQAAADTVVHVAGAVKHPGVYHLASGARIEDAMRAAGGAIGDADSDALDLAAIAESGSQIYVPTRSQTQAAGGAAAFAGRFVTSTQASVDSGVSSATSASRGQSSANHGRQSGRVAVPKLTDPNGPKIDINSAQEADLERVPGIGPGTAARILSYRLQNGRFATVQDLMEVSGIGHSKFAHMSPFLTAR